MISVCLGGFFGAMGRYYLSNQISQRFNRSISFPLATFFVNLIGCFLIGIVLNFNFTQNIYLLIVIGFLGAFTTFSTFAVEVVQLLETKQYMVALIYIVSSGIFGIGFTIIGLMIL